ncbi:phosphatidylserine synthase [Paracoccidioides lutzii Pb01]|uniref:Phosphatidylserine synthase n=1 Tax=Paracoccidioides lutzii (strain ATCC MYA-826 / Pb01) TaxID=502779 RepID=C1H2V8_PARBA|nr:phosphatidylserine synthase [Paracoccidioides lutzii Pb01]EEH34052.2 phosphatidylserine synthase [Paracoccidioides lutzii Pb01]
MSRRSSAAPSPAGSDAPSNDTNSKDRVIDKQKMLLSADSGHFSLLRALHLADLVTELNGFCGGKSTFRYEIRNLKSSHLTFHLVMSVFSSMRYCLGESTQYRDLWIALSFMPFGLLFDFMDGKIARWRRKASMMGQELDSLADLVISKLQYMHDRHVLLNSPSNNLSSIYKVSFGIAPAATAFAIGMRSPLDHIFLTFFVLCGLTRLARFNVTVATLPKDTSGKAQYFEGTPIPTTLVIAALMAYWVSQDWILGEIPFGVVGAGSLLEFHPAVGLFVVHGCLMVSRTIHIPKL